MTEELSLAVAFAAGLASFFAPCVLPVVPGYIGFVAGGPDAPMRRRAATTGAFVLGFGTAFTLIGLLVGAAGTSMAFREAGDTLERLGGALIVAFGLTMLGLIRIPLLGRDLRYHGTAPLRRAGPVLGAAGLGAAFGVGWSPCVGPILAGILVLAGLQGGAAGGALLLGTYAAGLAVPFLVVGLGAGRAAAALRRLGSVSRGVEFVGGVLLVVLGVFVFTGATARLTSLLV